MTEKSPRDAALGEINTEGIMRQNSFKKHYIDKSLESELIQRLIRVQEDAKKYRFVTPEERGIIKKTSSKKPINEIKLYLNGGNKFYNLPEQISFKDLKKAGAIDNILYKLLESQVLPEESAINLREVYSVKGMPGKRVAVYGLDRVVSQNSTKYWKPLTEINKEILLVESNLEKDVTNQIREKINGHNEVHIHYLKNFDLLTKSRVDLFPGCKQHIYKTAKEKLNKLFLN